MILPFAYAQALFADGQYDKAADMLREALKNASPQKEGVFFPRGLYANDDVLFAQIEKLVDRIDRSGNDADLHLLLGYQLLGVGETGYAREPLEEAARDPQDAAPAGVLLSVLEKMEKEAGSAVKTQSDRIRLPEPKADSSTAATVGEMMSNAQAETTGTAPSTGTPVGSVGSTPSVPAETPPVVPPEEKPDVQKAEPQPPAQNNDGAGGVEASQASDNNAAVAKAGWLDGPGSGAWFVPAVGPSRAEYQNRRRDLRFDSVAGLGRGGGRVEAAGATVVVILVRTGCIVPISALKSRITGWQGTQTRNDAWGDPNPYPPSPEAPAAGKTESRDRSEKEPDGQAAAKRFEAIDGLG